MFQVELEITLGSLTLFLSPRQLHVLLELAHGLASPDLEDVSNVVPRTYTGKPIAGSDFSRIEHELIQHTYPAPDLRTTVIDIYKRLSSEYVTFAENAVVYCYEIFRRNVLTHQLQHYEYM